MTRLQIFYRLVRPALWADVTLAYALGLGIARYLGVALEIGALLVGYFWLLSLQFSGSLLAEYFLPPLPGGNWDVRAWREKLLPVAFIAISVVVSLTMVMMRGIGHLPMLVVMGLMFLGTILYVLPPVRLIYSGIGEFVMSVMVALLIPALAFTLQSHLSLRLVTMTSLPVLTLHWAMMLALQLPSYASDQKYGRQALMQRLGWQKGMLVHDLLALGAYPVLLLAILQGLPRSIGLPAVLGLPLALAQVWMVGRIGAGAKPNWTGLKLLAMALYGLTVYWLTLGYWIH